jgi:hypothetical protein
LKKLKCPPKTENEENEIIIQKPHKPKTKKQRERI